MAQKRLNSSQIGLSYNIYRLKDQLYEREFENCKKKRNEDSKTFDLKWEKPKFYKATFR